MTFVPFSMERWQSTWEFHVSHNLSESGVHPLRLSELMDLCGITSDELQRIPLGYSQTNGTEALRDRIASLYPGARRENVLVTTGSAEANFIVCWALLAQDTHMTVLAPTYMQTWGLGANFGAQVTPLWLRDTGGWEPIQEDIARTIGKQTSLVTITNPNNPTGHVLKSATLDSIIEQAAAANAWVLSDEIYQGAELSGETTPSLWGRYERVVVTSGLSKAYGLPGLRIGWVVGPADFIQDLWSRHDYTVIGPSPITDFLAERALRIRDSLLARTRGLLNENLKLLEEKLDGLPGFHWHTPEAGAICYIKYESEIASLALAERLRTEHDTLIVPGSHFDMESYLRLGYGETPQRLSQDLDAFREGILAELG